MMAQAFNFAPMTDYAVQERAIERRRKMADMLQAQGTAPIEPGRMAGGYVVPISPLEGAAKMAQTWAAGRMQDRADEQSRDLMRQRQAALADTLTRFQTAAQGTPEQDLGDDEMLGVRATLPARAPDRAAAMAALTSNPEAIQFARMLAPQMFAEAKPMAVGRDQRVIDPNTGREIVPMAPQQPKMQRVEIPAAGGGTRVGFVDMNNPNPLSTFVEAGAQGPRMELSPGGIAYNPFAIQPGMTLPNPNNLMNFGPDGRPVVNQPLVDVRKEIARSGASNPQTTVINAGPKAFAQEIGKTDAEKLVELRKSAEAANSTLGTVANLRSAIARGVYSGGTANLQTTAAGFINGITGLTPKGLPGSEQFKAEAAKLVLDHIKSLGANPSNADREFIEKTVPRITSSPEARDQLITYMEQKAKAAISLFQEADVYARQNNGLGGFNLIRQPGGAQNSPGGAPTTMPGNGPQPRASGVTRYDANGNEIKQ